MIPSGATHQCHIGEYWDFEAVPVPLVWRGGEWMKDDSNWARIWTKLESVGKIRRQPKRIRKPTHVYMGELFLLDGSKLWIWSFAQTKWSRLWKSFDHDEMVLLFKSNKEFEIVV